MMVPLTFYQRMYANDFYDLIVMSVVEKALFRVENGR